MDHQATSTQVAPPKIRILRQVAFLGAPLLLLIGIMWPNLAAEHVAISAITLVLLFTGLLTFIDPAVRLRHPRNLALIMAIATFAASIAGFFYWRAGSIVAEATFNRGIAPFGITVREVRYLHKVWK